MLMMLKAAFMWSSVIVYPIAGFFTLIAVWAAIIEERRKRREVSQRLRTGRFS
jgi:hypothetical protein